MHGPRRVGLWWYWLFALGAALAGLAGLMAGPITSVQPGMGEPVLIMTLVVIVTGGIFLLQNVTRDEALAWAHACPAAQWATVEVRALAPCYVA